MVVEAILSFVGLGVKSQSIAWGQMIADGRAIDLPGAVEFAGAGAGDFRRRRGFNMLGDGLRRTLDVRMLEGAAHEPAGGARPDHQRRCGRRDACRLSANLIFRWRRVRCWAWLANPARASR